MNTLNTNFTNDQQSIKRLFRILFLLQIQLENYDDDRFYFHNELKEMIQTIDQLMDALIDKYEFQES